MLVGAGGHFSVRASSGASGLADVNGLLLELET